MGPRSVGLPSGTILNSRASTSVLLDRAFAPLERTVSQIKPRSGIPQHTLSFFFSFKRVLLLYVVSIRGVVCIEEHMMTQNPNPGIIDDGAPAWFCGRSTSFIPKPTCWTAGILQPAFVEDGSFSPHAQEFNSGGGDVGWIISTTAAGQCPVRQCWAVWNHAIHYWVTNESGHYYNLEIFVDCQVVF